MTTQKIINDITEWTADKICRRIKLKVPDDYSNDEEYTVEYMTPQAFPLFVPAQENLPPNIKAPVPSIAVQLMSGKDNIKDNIRTLKIRLCLSTWNPGIHPGEKYIPAEQGYKKDQAGEYERNVDGWKDLYNLQDIVLQELEGTEAFAGVQIKKDEPIEYGPFTEGGVIVDYYPYWLGWVSFTVYCGVVHRNPYEELLN